MINNCLVTKLKGVVDNDNLCPLGYGKFKINLTDETLGATVRFTERSTLKLLDATWLGSGSRELTIDGHASFYPNKKNIVPDVVGAEYCTILVPRYTCYAYANLVPLTGNIFDYGFKYVQTEQVDNFAILDISGIAYSEIGSSIIEGYKKEFNPYMRTFRTASFRFSEPLDVTGIGANGGLIMFDMGNCGLFNDVYGSLDSLGFSNISMYFAYLPNTKNVSLDLVNYVNNHRSSGRTSGTINLRYLGNLTVKVNGTVIELELKKDNILAWTADSITLDGNPIG